MSEDAGAIADAGTAEGDSGVTGTATDPEDSEAEQLLGDMLDKDPEELAGELERIKRESRKWESRSKANAAAAEELKALKQQNMTELEKAQAAQRDAEERATTAIATHNRVMAAAAHNLPVDLIDDLGSGTEEEIGERAERFARVIEERAREIANDILAQSANRNGMPMGARPVESMRPGSAPASGETPQDANAWFRQLFDNR